MKLIAALLLATAIFNAQAKDHKHCAFMAKLVALNQIERQSVGSLTDARQRVVNSTEMPVEWKRALLNSIRITLTYSAEMSPQELELDVYDICMR